MARGSRDDCKFFTGDNCLNQDYLNQKALRIGNILKISNPENLDSDNNFATVLMGTQV